MSKPLDPIPTLARMTAAHDRAVAERDALRIELVKADALHEADSAMLAAAHDVCERKDREIERLNALRDSDNEAACRVVATLTARLSTAMEEGAAPWRESFQRGTESMKRVLTAAGVAHLPGIMAPEAAVAQRIATLKARIATAREHLGAALIQVSPTDDAILVDLGGAWRKA